MIFDMHEDFKENRIGKNLEIIMLRFAHFLVQSTLIHMFTTFNCHFRFAAKR